MLTKTRTKDAGASPDAGRTGKGKAAKATRAETGKGRGKAKGKGEAASAPLVPTLPSVNLLPPAVVEKAHVARLRTRFAVAAGVAVAAVAAGWVLQAGAISSAEDELAAEQARGTALAGQVAELTPVRTFYTTVETNRLTIQETMAREVLLSDVVDQLFTTAPAGVTLQTVEATVDSAPLPAPGAAGAAPAPVDPTATGGSCPSPDPYAAPESRAGCITVSGAADSRAQLGAWERRLDRSDLFTDLFISDSQTGGTGAEGAVGADGAEPADAITFTASVSVTTAAYAGRYADPAFVEGTDQ